MQCCVYYLVRECKADRPSVGPPLTAALCILIFANFSVSSIWTADRKYGKWGVRGWVRLGSLSIQPGEFMKVLPYPFFRHFATGRGSNKTLTIFYMGVSFGTVFVLVMSRDLGNAGDPASYLADKQLVSIRMEGSTFDRSHIGGRSSSRSMEDVLCTGKVSGMFPSFGRAGSGTTV